MLPGRSPDQEPICRDCADITTALTCTRCKRESERFRSGLCIRCTLTDDLTAVLKPGDDFRLRRLISLLTETVRPESIYTTTCAAAPRPGNYSKQSGTEHSRSLTRPSMPFPGPLPPNICAPCWSTTRMMPGRGNENLTRFEHWLATRISNLPDDGTSQVIERYAAWHHLKRIRNKATDTVVNLETVTHAAKQDITEAGKLLIWLRDSHGIAAGELRQAHIDEYLSTGPSTRKHIRNFVRWLNRDSTRRGHLDAPFRPAQSTPMITQAERIELVRNCLEHGHVIRSTRVAGLILLLWAHPLNKIVMLRHEHISITPEGMLLKLGTTPATIPAAITEMFWSQREGPENQNTTNSNTSWLFPGTRAGQHLHPATLSERLKVLGIDAQRARNATLRDLTQEVDARTLIDLLDYSPAVITQHAARAATRMSDYIVFKKNQRP